MLHLTSLYEAFLTLQEQEKQAPSQDSKTMFNTTLNRLEMELEDLDYFYLSVFAEALISSKKLSKANDLPFEHLGLIAHSLREFSSSTS